MAHTLLSGLGPSESCHYEKLPMLRPGDPFKILLQQRVKVVKRAAGIDPQLTMVSANQGSWSLHGVDT